MKKFLVIWALTIAAFTVAFVPASQEQEKKADPVKFMRGAQRTPVPKIVAALKAGTASIYRAAAAPVQVVTVPPRLSMWGNSQFGCCVSSESAFAIADYSTYAGDKEIFIPEATLISWARAHGWLNGADLLSVIEDMQADGVKDETGMVRKAGKASAVDYSNEATLQSAIAQGPVSIAIDANALPSGAGNKSGWSAFGGRSYPNTDHCVSLGGYGPTAELFKALQVTMPSGAPANGYFLFTWNTIGVVDHKWLMNTCVEAWVRNPTIVGLDPPPPPPPPGKIVVVVQNVIGGTGLPVKFSPLASGGTSPYLFFYDYGDGVQDAGGTHTYKQSGTYKVVVTAIDSAQDIPAGTYYAVPKKVIDDIQQSLDTIRKQ